MARRRLPLPPSLFSSLSLFVLLSCFLRKRCCRLNFFHWLLSARTSKSVCLTRSRDARLQSEREGPVLFGRRVPNHLSSLLLTSTTTVPLHRVPTLLGMIFFQWHRAQEVQTFQMFKWNLRWFCSMIKKISSAFNKKKNKETEVLMSNSWSYLGIQWWREDTNTTQKNSGTFSQTFATFQLRRNFVWNFNGIH